MTETPQRTQTQQGRDVLPSISVVLCCHNSAERLPETLRHLSEQRIPAGLTWEILVIDNASNDGTPQLVQEFASRHSQLTVRLIHESRLGQGHARQRGMSEAAHDVILFVDDDNWLAADYVAILAETLHEHPEISGLGGTSSACCEGPAPAWLERYQGWYALTGMPADRASLWEEKFLWTAGAAFRRKALDRAHALGLPLLVSGRRGNSLDGGEDEELCHLVRLAGGSLFRHSGMHFKHYLPARRLTWEYLRRLHYASGLVSVKLDVYRNGYTRTSAWPAWLVGSWSAQMVNVCLRILSHPVTLFRLKRAPLEGNEQVLNLEAYRGRLAALWSHRRSYRKMIARSATANVAA
jgi:glycosyltransferase involved in cell wall biosynthesis